VIKQLLFAAASAWFLWWDLRLLWIAFTKGYVMALSKPFYDSVETRQTRVDNPQKFWANVIVGVLLLPMAIGAATLAAGVLWTAFHSGSK